MQNSTSSKASNAVNIARAALSAESAAINALLPRIGAAFSNVVEKILVSSGRVVVCGMGKSGLIGQKIAATFASTGTPSFFLHPAEALHGDLGMIVPGDIVLLISNSGETEEVIRLLPALKYFENTIIALTGGAKSTLAQAAHFVLDASVEREICPLNLAPTTSTIVTMAMGDALAVALMDARNFQPQDFARFHPGGSLGRKLLAKVSDSMRTKHLPLVAKDVSLREAMVEMTSGRLGLAVVVEENAVVGILTDGDLRRAFLNPSVTMDSAISAFMTTEPLTVSPDTSLMEAEQLMLSRKIKSLIVVQDGAIRGVIELFDNY